MTDLNKEAQAASSRRNSIRAVTCCALCMVALFFPLPRTHRNVSSLRIRKNFAKEAIAASNLTGADVRRRQVTNASRKDANRQHSNNTRNVRLDFLVAGFAKCGTTSLLRTLEAHNETGVPHKEQCSLDMVDNDDKARAAILYSLQNASALVEKRGIKCPFSFTTTKSLTRLQEWFPSTKIIYGLRHPVKAFESYYNYRVSNFYLGKVQGPIPPAETLVGSKEWARVSTSTVQFERVLKQLKNGTKLKHPVFMYTLEQMDDDGENVALRKELGSFLELEYPIKPLAKYNVNKRVGARGHKETIDICDAKYTEIRRILVTNGKKTQQWIRDEMLPYATVANRDGFDTLLKQWAVDPCDGESRI